LSFTSTPTTSTYTLSLHDALPISSAEGSRRSRGFARRRPLPGAGPSDGHDARKLEQAGVGRAHLAVDLGERRDDHVALRDAHEQDRKSTRLNSSHRTISYAVFCLK